MASKKEKEPINTTPVIAEYDKAINMSTAEPTDREGFCYTEWIEFRPNLTDATGSSIVDNYSKRTLGYCYQFVYSLTGSDTETKDWYYGSRTLTTRGRSIKRIRYGMPTSEIDNVYAYCSSTGQILFAGRNTEYYGYANINDMP